MWKCLKKPNKKKEPVKVKRDEPYWLGPYGVRVPIYVDWVMAEDMGNNIYRDGGTTEMAVRYAPGKFPTESDYKAKYATQYADGNWWYDEEHCKSWIQKN